MNANCQTLVSPTLARDEVPVMVALRLFLPESWTSGTGQSVGKILEHDTFDAARSAALQIKTGRFGCVLADAGYGLSAPFRQGLTARTLEQSLCRWRSPCEETEFLLAETKPPKSFH
jgi:SRSO17 transposase